MAMRIAPPRSSSSSLRPKRGRAQPRAGAGAGAAGSARHRALAKPTAVALALPSSSSETCTSSRARLRCTVRPAQAAPPATSSSSLRAPTASRSALHVRPCSRRGVVCHVTKVRVSERLASTVPYLLPLFDGLKYGKFFFQQYPISMLIVSPLAPLIKIYYTVPLAPLIAFFALFSGVVMNPRFSRFVRFNTMQSILLDMALIVPSLLDQYVTGGPADGGMGASFLQLKVTFFNTIFIFLIVSFLYAVGCCLTGQKAKIPFIGDAADAQMDRRS